MHENAARDRYEKTMKGAHTNFNVTDSGFIINPEWSFIGATHVLKVCMGVVQFEHTINISLDAKFCKSTGQDYFHYIPFHLTQLFVCNANYCDYCVCTFSKDEEHDFHQVHF